MSDESNYKNRPWLTRLTDLLNREPKNKEQLMEVLRHAEERHLLSAEMLSMIESVLQVSEMQVREVMVPKSQMVVLNSDYELNAILPLVIDSGHSRFPVLNTESDDIVGILLAKDLLRYYFDKEDLKFDMNSLLRPVIFVPQSKRLDILLREFRVNRNHMAVVLDEYGHVAGLVTIEDLLEQIVGEIEDEYDIDEEDYIKKHSEGLYTVKASTAIDDFNEYFDSDLNDENFDTIGGLVLQAFGHLPKRGETITLENFRFKVLHSDKRRIYLLEMIKEKPSST